jgi:hypothetical protein
MARNEDKDETSPRPLPDVMIIDPDESVASVVIYAPVVLVPAPIPTISPVVIAAPVVTAAIIVGIA